MTPSSAFSPSHENSANIRVGESSKPTLRILHIIASVDLTTGGPVEGLILPFKHRISSGDHIEVVTLDAPDAPCIKEFPFEAHGLGPALHRYRYTPRLARWIVENSARFDVAVIHGLWNHASIGGWQGCRRAGLPYVIFSHGMINRWSRNAYPLKHLAKQIFWLVQGRVLRDASEVLFTCEEEKRLAEGCFFGYRYHPRVVAYAASDAPAGGSGDEAVFRSLVPQLGERPYLLFLSRIHEKKGCDLLLEGFARAVKRPELNLVMAGPSDGDLGEQLRRQAFTLGIAERVHWPGMVRGAAKAGAFRGAEAFILTSHQENFGIAVAEALAFGRPVLISDQINIWGEIEAGGGGLVAPDTVEGAIRLIEGWENMKPQKRIKMALAARSVYDSNFTIEAAARDLRSALIRASRTHGKSHHSCLS